MSAETSQALGTNTLPAGESERIRTLIEKWTSAYLDNRMADWERFWTETPVLMPTGHEQISGRGEITDYLKRNYGELKSFRFSEWSLTGHDDLAVVSNHLELETERTAGGTSDHLNQMIVLRRSPDGDWHVQAVIMTPSVQPE